jgi:molybdate transport system permease protein
MDAQFAQTLWLTFKLAVSTTAILILIGLPFAYWLAYTTIRIKPLIEALVSMPMVLPPSVIGYYMLVIYSPQNWFGDWLSRVFDVRLAFSFEGVLIASVIFSLPFMIQPLHSGLRSLPVSLRDICSQYR